ncbi:hypothetical protein GJAV_G00053000 [Gymnothorax javanicus]|nr:hypothetical protein GJAV_G00053000 [Gymnothorax javanicus]
MAEGPGYGGLNNNCSSSRIKKTVNISVPPTMHLRKKVRQSQPKRNIHNRVVLEKVLGITTSSSCGLACDPNAGLVAYPAGCVVVVLHPRKVKQWHILNFCRKPFSSLAFSQDGKYLVTGESGHMPCVRVWDVAERTQVAEVQCHKYGVACVAFSTNGTYIVSVGYQHDMTVSVWEWRKGTVIASNKVSSGVLSVSFSEDNSYFVTAGNRHVKFWYLEASKEQRVNSTVPLIGRTGLLGTQRNNMFCGSACGLGNRAGITYCITSSGLLCQFNSRRELEAWVDLKTTSARCLTVSKDYVFCGCAEGTVRVFSPHDLHYITTLHRPHRLGVDITQGVQSGHLFSTSPEAKYPDTVALTFDPVTCCLTCVYNDHSVYVWDIHDIRNVGKVYSALYHSGCVWSVETYPDLKQPHVPCLPPGSFLTCSSDNTIRLWHSDPQNQGLDLSYHRNLYSHDLMKIVYMGKDTKHLQCDGEPGEGSNTDAKSGIKALGISPDGQHLVAGDRSETSDLSLFQHSVFGLQFMDELLKIEAHDSEILCLEFSPPETGLRLLASASRDRLIHIFNMEKEYSLEQTVYDHSASITAIKFSGVGPDVRMVSCGADKSIYFRTAEKSADGLSFLRSHHVVEKTTLYDMDLDATRSHAAIACQDRNIRVYNVRSGKLKRTFKGSLSDEGTLLKAQMDPSGMYLATSCSDKNICIFDYASGECVASLFGHSEIVTGMRFSQDCKHLITVSGDSCVFVWRLDWQMTNSMRKRLAETRLRAETRGPNLQIRRQTYITVPRPNLPLTGEEVEEEEEEEEEEEAETKAGGMSREDLEENPKTPARDDSADDMMDPTFLQTNGKLPMWARRLGAVGAPCNPPEPKETGPYRPRGRWAEQCDPQAIRSVLETRSLQLPLSPSPCRGQGAEGEEGEEEEGEEDPRFHPQSLDSLLGGEEDEEELDEGEERSDLHSSFPLGCPRPAFLPLPDNEELFPTELHSPETSDYILYPSNSTALSTGMEGSEFDVKGLCEVGLAEELSPDSAFCVGSAESQASNQDQPQEDTDSLSQVSSTGSVGLEEEEENEEEPQTLLRQHFDTLSDCLASNEKFDTDLRNLQPSTESIFLNPRLSISTRFLSRFQAHHRSGIGPAPRPSALPTCISEEPSSDASCSLQAEVCSRFQADSSVDLQERDVNRVQTGRSPSAARRSCSSWARLRKRPLQSRNTVAAFRLKSSLGEEANGAQPSSDCQSYASSSPRKPPLRGPERETVPQARSSRQSYMGTTASSRAKKSKSGSIPENLNTPLADMQQPAKSATWKASSTHESLSTAPQDFKENLRSSSSNLASTSNTSVSQAPPPGNHHARATLHLDLCAPDRTRAAPSSPGPARSPLKPRRRTVGGFHPSALVTPTEMKSLGKEGRSYITSIEESLASGRVAGDRSPALPRQPDCGAELSSAAALSWPCRTKEPPSGEQQENPSATAPPSADPPFQDSASPITGSEALNLQTCKRVVNELQHSLQRAVSLYGKLCSVEDKPEQQLQMRTILTDAFAAVQRELDGVCACGPRPPPSKTSCSSAEESPGRHLKDDRTVALLEKYSEMLLRIAEKKMDCN